MSILSKNLRTPVFMIAAVLSFLAVHTAARGHAADTISNSINIYKKLSSEEIIKIIQVHAEWQSAYKDDFDSDKARNDKRKANLSGADLSGADLRGVSLVGARLIKVNLQGADLSNSKLMGADLFESYLGESKLIGADLSNANLRNTKLWNADLSDATIGWGANLEGANLIHADLNRAVFEPTNLPKTAYIAFAKNLEKMVYEKTPQELKKLRNKFKEDGFIAQERKITYAIKRCERLKAPWYERYPYYLIFELTTAWGMAPWRALLWLLLLILIFMIPYAFAIRHRVENRNCIYRKWSDDCMLPDIKAGDKELLPGGSWRAAVILGGYFSVLSAFSIDWQGLNVDNWIQRLQAKEYSLSATGWVRTVSGIQALFSVYLIAIWLLTYSSRPFE